MTPTWAFLGEEFFLDARVYRSRRRPRHDRPLRAPRLGPNPCRGDAFSARDSHDQPHWVAGAGVRDPLRDRLDGDFPGDAGGTYDRVLRSVYDDEHIQLRDDDAAAR